MRFKLDENLPRAARALLESRGWDVHDVHEEGLAGALDPEIRAACDRENRVLVTLDTDFSDVRLLSPESPGVMLLRPHEQSIPATLSCLDGAVRLLSAEEIGGALWLVERERIRIRIRRSPSGA